jgi:hypothetical protein
MKKIFAAILCVLVMCSFCVPALADNIKSPVGEKVHEVTVRNGIGVEGVTVPDVATEVKDGDKVTVKPDPKKGDFDNWTIYLDYDNSKAVEGRDYIIVSGSLTGDTLTIIPKTDLIICGNYDGKITDPNTGKPADPDAPQTGSRNGLDKLLYIGGGVLMLAIGLLIAGYIVASRRRQTAQ